MPSEDAPDPPPEDDEQDVEHTPLPPVQGEEQVENVLAHSILQSLQLIVDALPMLCAVQYLLEQHVHWHDDACTAVGAHHSSAIVTIITDLFIFPLPPPLCSHTLLCSAWLPHERRPHDGVGLQLLALLGLELCWV